MKRNKCPDSSGFAATLFFIVLFSLNVPVHAADLARPDALKRFEPQKVPSVVAPNTLRTLQAMPSRSMLIDALMASPASRTAIEASAKKAGTPVTQLRWQALERKPQARPDVAKPPGCPHPLFPQLDWTAGIKFTFVKHVPWICFPENNKWWTTKVGELMAENVKIYTGPPTLDYHLQNDVLWIPPPGGSPRPILRLYVNLPPGINPYMIAIQGIYDGDVAVVAKSGSNESRTPLQTVYSTTVGGLVTLTNINVPAHYADRGIVMLEIAPRFRDHEDVLFGGITITRL